MSAGQVKATAGLSDLALRLLAVAGDQLSKQERRKIYALRAPATTAEVEKFLIQAMAEIKAAARTEAAREKRRLEWLKRLNEMNPEEEP